MLFRSDRPEQLAERHTLGFGDESESQAWELRGQNGESVRVEHSPRLLCHEFAVLTSAAVAGLGIALLPESVVRVDLDAGRLERVLEAWTLPQGIFHIVFPSRRGLLPAVRAFIDFLGERLATVI